MSKPVVSLQRYPIYNGYVIIAWHYTAEYELVREMKLCNSSVFPSRETSIVFVLSGLTTLNNRQRQPYTQWRPPGGGGAWGGQMPPPVRGFAPPTCPPQFRMGFFFFFFFLLFFFFYFFFFFFTYVVSHTSHQFKINISIFCNISFYK